MRKHGFIFLITLFCFDSFVSAAPNVNLTIRIEEKLGEDTGVVTSPRSVLENSGTMFKLFEQSDCFNTSISLSLCNVAEPLSTLGLGIPSLQTWLEVIVDFLNLIHNYKDQNKGFDDIVECLYEEMSRKQIEPEDLIKLVLTGEYLEVPELVSACVSRLADSIYDVDSKVLFGLMRVDGFSFAEKLAHEILKKHPDCFYPIFMTKPEEKLYGHKIIVRSAQFSKDGKQIVTSSMDRTARVWEKDDSGKWVCKGVLNGHCNSVKTAQFSEDGNQIVLTSLDDIVSIWKRKEGKEFAIDCVLKGNGSEIKSAVCNKAGNLILVPAGSNVNVWNKDNSDCWKSKQSFFFDCNGGIKSIFFSEDENNIFAFCCDGIVKLFGKNRFGFWVIRGILSERFLHVASVRFNNGCKEIVTISGLRDIKIWEEGKNGKWFCKTTLKGHLNEIYGVRFSEDGNQLVSCSDDSTVRVWERIDGDSWYCKAVLKDSPDPIDQMFFAEFNYNGDKLITDSFDGHNYTAAVWDLKPHFNLKLSQVSLFVLASQIKKGKNYFMDEASRCVLDDVARSLSPEVREHFYTKIS